MMRSVHRHIEHHRTDRIGWLRAAVLGANDGIVSTARLLLGVAAANISHDNILVTGIAGLVAGAMSMATGEYVSVYSQADTEKSDLAREQAELQKKPTASKLELTAIYVDRGLDPDLVKHVAEKLMEQDALGAHARDELGISDPLSARPVQAALASATSFAIGAALPLAVAALATRSVHDSLGIGDFTFLSGNIGGNCGPRWRCKCFYGCVAGKFLGLAGHGNHRRGGSAV